MLETGFIWIMLACAGYGALHSLLASRAAKRLAAGWLGEARFQRFYRLFFSAMGTLTALPLIVLAWLLPDQVICAIPTPWVYLTVTIQGIAALMILQGVMETGAMRFIGIQQLFETKTSAEPDFLVVNGLYRWVRHPLYTATIVLLWLMPVMTWNLLALALGLSIYMLIGTIFEEQKLVALFGQEYEQYRQVTPRIVPGMKFGKR